MDDVSKRNLMSFFAVLQHTLLKGVASGCPAARLQWSLSWKNCVVFCTSIQKTQLLCPIKPNASKPVTLNIDYTEFMSKWAVFTVSLWIKYFQILSFLPDCSSICLVCTKCSWKGSTGKKPFQIPPRDWELFLILPSLSLCTQLGMKSLFLSLSTDPSGT